MLSGGTGTHVRNFANGAREQDQDRRDDEYGQRVIHESGAGLRCAVRER